MVRDDVTRAEVRAAAVAAVAELNPAVVAASFAKLLAGLATASHRAASRKGEVGEGAT
jgi:hypothetical protein